VRLTRVSAVHQSMTIPDLVDKVIEPFDVGNVQVVSPFEKLDVMGGRSWSDCSDERGTSARVIEAGSSSDPV